MAKSDSVLPLKVVVSVVVVVSGVVVVVVVVPQGEMSCETNHARCHIVVERLSFLDVSARLSKLLNNGPWPQAVFIPLRMNAIRNSVCLCTYYYCCSAGASFLSRASTHEKNDKIRHFGVACIRFIYLLISTIPHSWTCLVGTACFYQQLPRRGYYCISQEVL